MSLDWTKKKKFYVYQTMTSDINHLKESSSYCCKKGNSNILRCCFNKNFFSIAFINALMLILSCNSITQLTESTPPVDYFIYTSQQQNNINTHRHLPSIESIYTLTNQAPGAAGIPDNPNNSIDLDYMRYLNELGQKTLALVKNSSHNHDNDLIDMEVARYAWHLMEKQSLLYIKNRINTFRPIVNELLLDSRVSDDCQKSINNWLDNLIQLNQWATLMWNSWGQFPPAGLFQGTFTDLGSYSSCMSIKDNDLIDQAQYCTFDYQPLIPTRPRFHSIYKKVLSVDSKKNQLVNGDFVDLDNLDGTPAQQMSQISSHGFSSERFKQQLMQQKTSSSSSSELDNKTIHSSLRANSSISAGRYNKRTIVQSAGGVDGKGTTNLTDVQYSNLLSASKYNNLTIKAEALIELAQKAQYFYYVKFRLGACLPSKCSKNDVETLAQIAGQRAILQINQVNCMKKAPVSLNGHQKTAIWILSILAFIAVVGTVIDLLGVKETNGSVSLVDWLLPFSIWTNGRRLFDSEPAGAHTDLECIHGLRFFSMLWVVYGHTILYTEYQAFTHFYDVIETQIPSLLLLPTLNANFSVDTFFVISGILTTYVTWEYTKGDARKFNKFAFAISRYIRLTPQLAIVILCFFLLPLFGEGPLYKQVTEDKANACYKNWAINLLYLQTYINSDKLCIDPSWWLSIEMTFHLISMIVIVVMIHNVYKGMVVNFALASILTLWGAIIHYNNGFAIQYLPSIPQRYEVFKEQTQWFFHRPYPHAASYFIGIALGYVLANRTIKKLKNQQVYQGWFVCFSGLIISLWGSYYWNLGAPYTQLQSTIYYNLCQILWPISIAWIILACSLGHGGIVNSILSAKCFVPLGRVTYMTYLSHALIIYYHSASMNIPVEPSRMLFLYLFVANTFLSLLLGVILTVVYESPILNLQKVLFNYLTKKFDPTIQERIQSEPLTNGIRSGENNHLGSD